LVQILDRLLGERSHRTRPTTSRRVSETMRTEALKIQERERPSTATTSAKIAALDKTVDTGRAQAEHHRGTADTDPIRHHIS